jgi:ketosteroid isomerase-like protein
VEAIETETRMPEPTHTPAQQASLEIAQAFIRAIEGKDFDAAAATLAPTAKQFFMHTRRTRTPEGAAAIADGTNDRAIAVAVFEDRTEVLAYTRGLLARFEPLIWRNHIWTVSGDGRRVFFQGAGDMVATRGHRPYRNDYVTRFDIENGLIVRMLEYADATLLLGLRPVPSPAERRAFLHAFRRLLPFSGRARP